MVHVYHILCIGDYSKKYLGVSRKWGIPLAGWFISWKIKKIAWMIIWGTLGKPPYIEDDKNPWGGILFSARIKVWRTKRHILVFHAFPSSCRQLGVRPERDVLCRVCHSMPCRLGFGPHFAMQPSHHPPILNSEARDTLCVSSCYGAPASPCAT